MSKVKTDQNTLLYENKQPMILNANWELVNLKEFSPGQSQLASKTSERLPNDASSGFEKSMFIHSLNTVAGIGCSAGVANLWCTNNLSSTMFMYHPVSFLILSKIPRQDAVWWCEYVMRHKEGNQLQSDYRHLSLVKVSSLFPLLQKETKYLSFAIFAANKNGARQIIL